MAVSTYFTLLDLVVEERLFDVNNVLWNVIRMNINTKLTDIGLMQIVALMRFSVIFTKKYCRSKWYWIQLDFFKRVLSLLFHIVAFNSKFNERMSSCWYFWNISSNMWLITNLFFIFQIFLSIEWLPSSLLFVSFVMSIFFSKFQISDFEFRIFEIRNWSNTQALYAATEMSSTHWKCQKGYVDSTYKRFVLTAKITFSDKTLWFCGIFFDSNIFMR